MTAHDVEIASMRAVIDRPYSKMRTVPLGACEEVS